LKPLDHETASLLDEWTATQPRVRSGVAQVHMMPSHQHISYQSPAAVTPKPTSAAPPSVGRDLIQYPPDFHAGFPHRFAFPPSAPRSARRDDDATGDYAVSSNRSVGGSMYSVG
jgi:hypothetical protein